MRSRPVLMAGGLTAWRAYGVHIVDQSRVSNSEKFQWIMTLFYSIFFFGQLTILIGSISSFSDLAFSLSITLWDWSAYVRCVCCPVGGGGSCETLRDLLARFHLLIWSVWWCTVGSWGIKSTDFEFHISLLFSFWLSLLAYTCRVNTQCECLEFNWRKLLWLWMYSL